MKNSRRVFKKVYPQPLFGFFFGIAQYTDEKMSNAPYILCLGCKEQKESQPWFTFYWKLSEIYLLARLLIMISQLRTNLKYTFNIPFRINFKNMIMGNSFQFHDGAQLKFYPHLAQRYYKLLDWVQETFVKTWISLLLF